MDITVLMENAKQIRMSYSTLQPRYVLELFNYDTYHRNETDSPYYGARVHLVKTFPSHYIKLNKFNIFAVL